MKLFYEKTVMFLGILFISIPVISQVTIGSGEPSIKGALLQLKEIEGAQDGDANSTKGLALPRVKLIKKKSTDISTTIYGVAPNEYSGDHTGLIVYNVNQCFDNMADDRGLYLWNGSEWQAIVTSSNSNSSANSYEFVDSRDGEAYLAGNFGVAGDWMLENLRYVPNNTDTGFTDFTHSIAQTSTGQYNKRYAYPDGATNNLSYVPNNQPTADWDSKIKNGILYNWYAATNLENMLDANQGEGSGAALEVGVRGICPLGWHIPSEIEWNQLEKVIYENASLYSSYSSDQVAAWAPWEPLWGGPGMPEDKSLRYRPSTGSNGHGMAMKAVCPPAADSTYNTEGKSLSSLSGGFNALLVGFRTSDPYYFFTTYAERAYFWTSSNFDPGYNDRGAYYRRIESDKAGVYRSANYKYLLMSVRCKKD